jgi:hypothetical protein
LQKDGRMRNNVGRAASVSTNNLLRKDDVAVRVRPPGRASQSGQVPHS